MYIPIQNGIINFVAINYSSLSSYDDSSTSDFRPTFLTLLPKTWQPKLRLLSRELTVKDMIIPLRPRYVQKHKMSMFVNLYIVM